MKNSNRTNSLAMLAVIGMLTLPTGVPAQLAINVDVNRNIFSATQSGVGVAPDPGTVWNPVVLSSSPATFLNVKDSLGNTLTSDITVTAASGSFNVWNNASAGNPNPLDLMNEYTYTGVYTVSISDLPAGQYSLYAFGQGDSDWQSGGFVIDAANGGASAAPANLTGDPDFRNLLRADALGKTYHKLDGTVDGSGTFTFSTTSEGYLNGFQLVQSGGPPIIVGLADQSVNIGGTVMLNPAVAGESPLAYQWQENGANLTDQTNATLTLTNVQASQNGSVYSLTASNALGIDSASMTLTVTVAPTNQLTINLDVNVSSGDHYTGPGVASDGGTVWNSFVVSSGSTTPAVFTGVNDSSGEATAVDITITPTEGSDFRRYSDTTLGNPNPLNLMKDYLYNNNGEYEVTVAGLDEGVYGLYVFAHGDQAGQNPVVTVAAANGGGSGQQGSTGDQYRNLHTAGAKGYSYLLFAPTVGADGTLMFTTESHLNGFQIQLYSPPSILGLIDRTVIEGHSTTVNPVIGGVPPAVFQWYSNGVALADQTNASLALNDVSYAQNGDVYGLVASNPAGTVSNSMNLTVVVTPSISGLDNQAVAPGALVTMAPTVSGVPAPGLQWLHDGGLLSDGPTGSGSTVSGSTSDTLLISNAQVADSGTYSLFASNVAGMVSNSMILIVSATNVPPDITGPIDQVVVEGNDAIFNASASGLPAPTLQWRVNGADIAGATGSSLTVTNVQYAQNGDVYSLVASNAAGTATNSATLSVLVAPTISQQPTNIAVTIGGSAQFSVTASGVPAVSYQWSRDGDPIPGATNAVLGIGSVQGADNGAVFSVEVANSVDSLVSSSATLTVLSTMTGTLLPGNGATNIAPDQQLRIVFSGGTPELTYTGKKLQVYDASDDSLFATIDTALFQTFSTDSATVNNAFVRSVQGNSFFYMPIAVYGNEAWITLNANERFEYGKTYYVTFDAGLFVDATGASFPGMTGSNSWAFSTKASGPATPTASTGPTEISVGLDGAGDFATLQGASDWIPQNNTLARTIRIEPGIYHDFAVFYQHRDSVSVVGGGATRDDVQIIYPNAAFTSGSSCGMVRVEGSDDLAFRNLTLDNEVYIANPLNNYGPFPGRLNVLVFKNSERLIFDNVLIKGGQDTLYADSGIGYFNGCEIWGSVDFIYGTALAVFDGCTIVQIRESGGPVCAPKTDLAAPYGEVFLDCTFPRALIANGYPYNVAVGSTTFMRPWGNDGYTAVINCSVGSQFSTKGWGEWSGRETTCRARESGTTLIGGGSVTPAQRQAAGAYWLNTIDPDYTNNPALEPTDPLLYGSPGKDNRVAVTVAPADFTVSAIFGHPYYSLGDWLPAVLPLILSQPADQTVLEEADVSFAVSVMGFPEPVYQWKRGEVNLPGETNATLQLDGVLVSDAGDYSVEVSNSAGAVSSAVATLTVLIPGPPSASSPSILSDGSFQFSASGNIGESYRVWGSTNVTAGPVTDTWTLLTNGIFGPAPILFQDEQASGFPQRFYLITVP